MKRSEVGDAIASEVAKAFGSDFRPDTLPRDGALLLTGYFEDIQRSLAPQFADINFAEFTRAKLNAHASKREGTGPYVHIDQHLDRWLLLAYQLLSIRAFYKLEGVNRNAVNALMTTCLQMAFDPTAFERMRADSVHLFTSYPESLRYAHHLSVGALVFVCCHELAHHDNDDIGEMPSHAIEYAADQKGFAFTQAVYAQSRNFSLLKPVPIGLAGIAILFWLFDLIERLAASANGRTRRKPSKTHPFALDRFGRLKPELEANADVRHFMGGYGEAVAQFRADMDLDQVA
ncbi:MAG: hypothetical protein AAGA38_18175 [Pseudomonadota bacterium]